MQYLCKWMDRHGACNEHVSSPPSKALGSRAWPLFFFPRLKAITLYIRRTQNLKAVSIPRQTRTVTSLVRRNPPMDLTLARAAAAFRGTDFLRLHPFLVCSLGGHVELALDDLRHRRHL